MAKYTTKEIQELLDKIPSKQPKSVTQFQRQLTIGERIPSVTNIPIKTPIEYLAARELPPARPKYEIEKKAVPFVSPPTEPTEKEKFIAETEALPSDLKLLLRATPSKEELKKPGFWSGYGLPSIINQALVDLQDLKIDIPKFKEDIRQIREGKKVVKPAMVFYNLAKEIDKIPNEESKTYLKSFINKFAKQSGENYIKAAELSLSFLEDPLTWVTGGIGKITKPTLKYVIEPVMKTKFIRSGLEAIKDTPIAEKFLYLTKDYQTERQCLAAVQQNGYALQYVSEKFFKE